ERKKAGAGKSGGFGGRRMIKKKTGAPGPRRGHRRCRSRGVRRRRRVDPAGSDRGRRPLGAAQGGHGLGQFLGGGQGRLTTVPGGRRGWRSATTQLPDVVPGHGASITNRPLVRSVSSSRCRAALRALRFRRPSRPPGPVRKASYLILCPTSLQ